MGAGGELPSFDPVEAEGLCVVIMCAMERFPSRYNVEWPEAHVFQCAMDRYPWRCNVERREARVFISYAP